MKWKTPKRWWESDPLRVSAFHYPSCLSKALQTINLNHLLPSSTKPFLTYAHYILNPLPLIYPPRSLTPSNASVTRLCLVLPSSGCGAWQCWSQVRDRSFDSQLSMEYVITGAPATPFLQPERCSVIPLLSMAQQKQRAENRFSKHITNWIQRLLQPFCITYSLRSFGDITSITVTEDYW